MMSVHLKNEFGRRGVRFMVGRDKDGRWVVSDSDKLVGGAFSDRASAVQYAMFESDHEPGAVCCVPDILDVSVIERELSAPVASKASRRD